MGALPYDWRSIGRGLWRMWGPRGIFTRLIPRDLDYYRPGFHPLQHDTSELLERFERALREAGAIEGDGLGVADVAATGRTAGVVGAPCCRGPVRRRRAQPKFIGPPSMDA